MTKYTGIPPRIQKRNTSTDVKQGIHKYSRGFGCAAWYADVQRSVQLYNCTIQLTDIQRFQYSRNEVPQSGPVDSYAAIDVVRYATRNPLLEMHSWEDIAKGMALSVAMQKCGCGRVCEFCVLVAL
jgi:hypothetical protein